MPTHLLAFTDSNRVTRISLGVVLDGVSGTAQWRGIILGSRVVVQRCTGVVGSGHRPLGVGRA